MKRLMFSALMLLIFITPVLAKDWTGVLSKVMPSVVQMYMQKGTCTSFVINKQQGYYLTAAHCAEDILYLLKADFFGKGEDGYIYVDEVVLVDRKHDIAVLDTSVSALPALCHAAGAKQGQEVLSIGHAYGEPKPFAISSNIAAIKTANSGRTILIKDKDDIPGMSGGPIVNTRGEVVSMVQQGSNDQRISYGTVVKEIYELTARFWEC